MKNFNSELARISTPLRLLAIFVLIVAGSSPALMRAQPMQSETMILRDVQVIDVLSGSVSSPRDVFIDSGRIAGLGDRPAGFNGNLEIDGQGLYLLPGLWDMHAHVRHPLAESLILPQFVANGVTGIREMSSECENPDGGEFCLEKMQQWQQQIAAGEITGPRLLALSSFPVDPPWDYQVSEAEIRGLVAEMDRRGVDLIKTYFRLSPQAFLWLADEASNRNLDVAGHLPVQMTAAQASTAGLRSLEHARDFLFDCYPGSAAFRQEARTQNPEPEIRQRMVDGFDAQLCHETFARFVENDTWYVPTHVTRRLDAFAGDPDFRNDPRLRYIWPEVRDQWKADADNMASQVSNSADALAMRAFYEKGLEITGLAHEAGVRVLLGTDSGDSFAFFGFSVHDELAELVKAGLSPAEALAAATSSAAEFLGMEQDYGTIEVGKRADLLLLKDNPLEDIGNSRSIQALFYNGSYYNRQALDAMLEEVVISMEARQ